MLEYDSSRDEYLKIQNGDSWGKYSQFKISHWATTPRVECRVQWECVSSSVQALYRVNQNQLCARW